jgi:DNA-binding response OmpR family regulator
VNKPSVLLVEDDLSVLDALGSAIESEGFELARAAVRQTVTKRSKGFTSAQ